MTSAEAYVVSLNASLYPYTRHRKPEVELDSTAAIGPAADGKCPLLELPQELRTLVWDYYLDSVPTLVKLEQYHTVHNSRRFWQPELSSVNRLIRSELLPQFYRRCRFHLQGFNEDGHCEVELFLTRTQSYQALHQNMRTVVIHGLIACTGRWLGEFDLGRFALNVDKHWKHSMEGEYNGMIADLETVLSWATQSVGPKDSRAPVLRKLLAIMRARGLFLCDDDEFIVDGDPVGY